MESVGLEPFQKQLNEAIVPLESDFLKGGFQAVAEPLGALRQQHQQMGLWLPHMPQHHGGMGLTMMEFAYLSEVLGRSPLACYAFGCNAPDAGNMELLNLFGTPEQQQRFLTPLAAGELRSCFAMTEPHNSGANPTQLSCRAERDGDSYVINGHKWFTTGADGAAFCIAMVITEDTPNPYERASMLIVPTDTPGYRRVRNIPVMGHAGTGVTSHSEVVFEGCRVPARFLLGKAGSGYKLAQARLGPGRIFHAMRWIGIAQRAFEMSCQRAVQRAIGADAYLGDSPLIQAQLAECHNLISASRLLVQEAARQLNENGAAAARDAIATSKVSVAATLNKVLDRAVQIHGALGMADDTVLAYFYREERAARIYDGPDEVHLISLGKRLLKKFR